MTAKKVALVTGSARGIGRAIAKRLAKDGIAIAVNYNQSEPAARAVVEEIAAEGGVAEAFKADVTDLTTHAGLFDAVLARFGQCDILVNNAGVAEFGPFAALDPTRYDRLAAISKGSYFIMQRAIDKLADGGRIINISTSLTRTWPTYLGAYAGSKAAIEQYTRALSKEVGHRGITVNAIQAGYVNTDMAGPLTEEQRSEIAQSTSLGRIGQPEDIADVAAFLASEQSRWITGQCIAANGGATA